ncbi:prepilin-type N-terminal cleavage/methylation domain-containing protein [Campylobacter sp. 50012-21]|uniref:type II secretion system protein n=1 Tax=Campylobacter magnus TaxID=3026462 RepID=UPI00235E8216|nr:prepilin-type N-terminal cleavage/methylation domain-containing protein [Campylobacter magnus]MDD0846618.1 prepilin-type N-terminal cleavage/methylation domain-containing protein [Campylobacter magnus]
MKKGFTMIELIFVIVILGILASVAIPRLAATRTDAEIATTVSNIRTLISDLSSYYVVKGEFGNAKWGDVTNVPIRLERQKSAQGTKVVLNNAAQGAVYLPVDGIDCIVFRVKDRDNTQTPARPAYIEIGKVRANKGKGTCKEVLEAEPIKAYLDLRVPNVTPIENNNGVPEAGVIVFESSISIY